VLFAEFGVHRQGKHLLLGSLALREVARFMFEIFIDFLKMEGERIIDGSGK